jgi:antitoxin component of MazEF toxin-antitoxin module
MSNIVRLAQEIEKELQVEENRIIQLEVENTRKEERIAQLEYENIRKEGLIIDLDNNLRLEKEKRRELADMFRQFADMLERDD